MKKTLWFDVDDVLVDTSPLTEASLRALTGKHIPVHSWPHHRFVDLYSLCSDGKKKMLRRWMDDQILEKATLRAGVAEAMRSLAHAGFSLKMITARDWHPEGEAITWRMAQSHGLPVDDVVVMAFEQSKADVLASRGEKVDGFVDDTPRHVRGCMEKGWASFLMDHPWNVSEDLPRVQTLSQFAGHFSRARQSQVADAPKPRLP